MINNQQLPLQTHTKDKDNNSTGSKNSITTTAKLSLAPNSTLTPEVNNNNNPAKRKRVIKTQTTRQPYFRWLGPTAICPPKAGTFRLLSVNLRSNESVSEPTDRKSVLIERPSYLDQGVDFGINNGSMSSINKNGKLSTASNGDGTSTTNATSNSIPTITTTNTTSSNNNNNSGNGSNIKSEGSPCDSSSPSVSDNESFPALPHKSAYRFFNRNMSNFLPYLPTEEFEKRLSQGFICECLLYAIAALSEKLSPANIAAASSPNPPAGGNMNGGEPPTPPNNSLAERYLEAAKRLVIPHLASPSVEIVFTLLLIAYAEFGEDRDSGLWAWSGMAIRMCYDLGLHKANSNGADDPDTKIGRRVFWSVASLDRIISCGTGRSATIPDKDIEHEPELGTTLPDGRTDPFPYLCRLFQLLCKVSNYINTFANSDKVTKNNNHVSPSSLSPESWDMMETFSQFQHEVSDFYTSLPPDLLFDVQNFQEFSKVQHSQVFLLLHIWNQALVLAVHHPTIVYPTSHLDVMGLMSNPHAELTGSGAISIADMIAFADLIEPNSFLANPFLSQPIHMAACASLTLWHTLPQVSPPHSLYTLQRTYSTCRQILARMQRIWRGISWHSRFLESLAASEPDVDLSVNPKGFITTRDSGVVRKANIDESTRRWLANEVGNDQTDDIYGLFIAGTTDDFNKQQRDDFNFLAGLRDLPDMAVKPDIASESASAAAVAVDGGTSVPAPPSAPVQQATTGASRNAEAANNEENASVNSNTAGGDGANFNSNKTSLRGPPLTPPDVKEEDTFKSFVMRNMDLEEYLRPANFAKF